MQQYRILVLTDHRQHSAENSLYPLVNVMNNHPRCGQLDVATQGFSDNDPFFLQHRTADIFAAPTDDHFAFHPEGYWLKKGLNKVSIKSYDIIWLRMPPPLSRDFLKFLKNQAEDQIIINDPEAIYQTGSKLFLTHFPELCPPLKACYSVEDIVDFKNQFPIVLKPFREYGGKGIIRIDGDQVWEGNAEISFREFVDKIKDQNIEYLGVKFLKNVGQGDKRIVVVNGKVMGASLRLPPKDSWICNVSMGGAAEGAEVDQEEYNIVARLNPVLSDLGIVMYGVDTLVGDDGKRVLSEINTTSIGGLPQIAQQRGEPLVEQAVDLIWQYLLKRINQKQLSSPSNKHGGT